MKRRDYIKLVTLGLIAGSYGGLKIGVAGTGRVIRALRPGSYPGRIKPLTQAKLRQNNRLAG